MPAPAMPEFFSERDGGSAIDSSVVWVVGGGVRAGRFTRVVVTSPLARSVVVCGNDMLHSTNRHHARRGGGPTHQQGGRVLTAYSRVTVMTTDRKVDIALPSALPMADVLPQVLRYCATDGADGNLTAWTLARLGGQPLPLTQTLRDAGVLDGDVLELRAQREDVRPALVEDVRDAVEDSADAAGGGWTPRTTITSVLVAGATVLAVAAVFVWLRPTLLAVDTAPLLVTVTASTAVLVAMAAWGAHFAQAWVAQVCAGVAMGWGYLVGTAYGVALELDPAVTLIIAAVAVTAVAGVARLLTESATAHLAVAVVLLVAGLAIAIAELSSVSIEQVFRVLPVLALLVSGVLPRLSLSTGGLASADYRVRHVGQMTTETLRSRYRQSNAILVGGLVGVSLVVVGTSVPLTFSDNVWDRYIALSLAIAAILRSRVYSRVQHMAPLRVAGIAVIVLQLVRLSEDVPGLRPWVVVVVLAALVLAVGVSTLSMSGITRARVKRVLNAVEFLVIVDLVVLLCGGLGVFSILGGVL